LDCRHRIKFGIKNKYNIILKEYLLADNWSTGAANITTELACLGI